MNDDWDFQDTWYPEEEQGEPGLPAYMAKPESSGATFGEIRYNRRKKNWILEGDPSVTQVIKRLFPAADAGKRGFVSFPDHWRYIADMNWVMLRFPLRIAPRDQERWQSSLEHAKERILRREAVLWQESFAQPLPSQFTGNLLDFQQAGTSFLLQQQRALLADEMGLGKTVQALAACAIHQTWPVLIVVPPHLLTNWTREIQRFVRVGEEERAPAIHVLKGLKPYALPKAEVYLTHYLLLRGWKQALPQMQIRTVIFDEIQELRHGKTEKYSAASLISDAAERVYGLSGTPIYNHGGEIYPVMNILDFHCLGDWEGFTREWCMGYNADVVAHPDQLGDYLRREGLMLRRTKADVLQELPPKRRLVQNIDWDQRVYDHEMEPVYQRVRSLIELGMDGNASQRAIMKEQIVSGERQATGLSKAPWVCAFVRALLEAGEKVLLFAHHHSVFDLYRKELSAFRPGFITGRETTAEKDLAVDRFTNGKTNLCCISLRAASGLNLQTATCVVFGELDWSPAVHSQAEDRAHRMGQKDSLVCYYLVCSKGSDQNMQDALGLKVSQFAGLMGEIENHTMNPDEAQRQIDRVIGRLTENLA